MEFVAMLLRYSAPIGLAAMGESVSQKAGVINIGLEGMMLTAAYFAMLGSRTTGNAWIGLLCGVAAALVLAVLQGFFTLRLAADQVVTGTAINLLAIGLTSTLYRRTFGGSGQLISVEQIPRIFGDLDLVLLAFAAMPVLVWFIWRRTAWGLATAAAGEYPAAVSAAGFSPVRLRWHAVLIGGLMAGIAGGYLSLGIAGSFAENMTVGRGFVAIALVTFGRWKPGWVFAASLLVGYVNSLQYELQAKGLGVPHQFFVAMPYLVALVVLVVVGKGTSVPAALGTPLRRDSS